MIDRFGMALLYRTVAFVSALVLWALIAIGRWGFGMTLPFAPVWWFTGIMAALGFVSTEGMVLAVFGYVFAAIHAWVTGEQPPKGP